MTRVNLPHHRRKRLRLSWRLAVLTGLLTAVVWAALAQTGQDRLAYVERAWSGHTHVLAAACTWSRCLAMITPCPQAPRVGLSPLHDPQRTTWTRTHPDEDHEDQCVLEMTVDDIYNIITWPELMLRADEEWEVVD